MEVIGLTGYLISTAAYFVYLFLLIAAKNNTFSGKLLFSSAVITLLGSALASAQIYLHMSLKDVLIVENVKYIFMVTISILYTPKYLFIARCKAEFATY